MTRAVLHKNKIFGPHQVLFDPNRSGHAARLAQLVERKALNLVVVGSSPTVGAAFFNCKTKNNPNAGKKRKEKKMRPERFERPTV